MEGFRECKGASKGVRWFENHGQRKEGVPNRINSDMVQKQLQFVQIWGTKEMCYNEGVFLCL